MTPLVDLGWYTRKREKLCIKSDKIFHRDVIFSFFRGLSLLSW